MGRPSFLVLDGQQRLTSLYQAIYGVGDSRFFIDLGALLAGADVDQAVKVFSAERAARWRASRPRRAPDDAAGRGPRFRRSPVARRRCAAPG